MKPKHPTIAMCACKSSQVAEIGHDPATNPLAVRYASGGTYHYPGITAAQFADLQKAKSVGAQLGKHIKTPGHKFTRIDPPPQGEAQ
jgi:hypothetical protein